MRGTPHHHEDQQVHLEVDKDSQNEASHAHIGSEDNEEDHVKETTHGTLVGVFFALQIVVVGRIGNQEDWDDVHNGDNHSQKAKLIIVALIKDFESSGEQNDEDSQGGKGHCVYDIHDANSFN